MYQRLRNDGRKGFDHNTPDTMKDEKNKTQQSTKKAGEICCLAPNTRVLS